MYNEFDMTTQSTFSYIFQLYFATDTESVREKEANALREKEEDALLQNQMGKEENP